MRRSQRQLEHPKSCAQHPGKIEQLLETLKLYKSHPKEKQQRGKDAQDTLTTKTLHPYKKTPCILSIGTKNVDFFQSYFLLH